MVNCSNMKILLSGAGGFIDKAVLGGAGRRNFRIAPVFRSLVAANMSNYSFADFLFAPSLLDDTNSLTS